MSQDAGPAVLLRKPLPEDLRVIRKIRDDPETQHSLLAYPHAKRTPADIWFQRKIADTQTILLVAIDKTAEVVGYVQFSHIHHAGRHANFGVAIAMDRRGQGYGQSTVKAALDHARTTLGLRKLLLEVRANNKAAHNIYENLGFRLVGRLSEHYFDGERFHDVDIMEKLLFGGDG